MPFARNCALVLLFATMPAACLPARAGASSPTDMLIEEEPERYDSEYYLDMLTFRPDRQWRDLWYGRDNAWMLRFGSLNVEQWALIQDLKFSAELSPRVRIRYRLEIRELLDERCADRSEIETEVRLTGDWYASALLSPAFWKRENDVGIGMQRRTAVDRFVRLDLRALDAANDFAYEHGDDIEGEKRIYSSHPFELSLQAREEIGEALRFGLSGSAVTLWRRENSFEEVGRGDYTDAGRRRKLDLWTEYDLYPGWALDLDLSASEYLYENGGNPSFTERHRVRELLPRLWHFAGKRTDGGPRYILSAGVQIRRERWSREGDGEGSFSKEEVLPLLTSELRLSDSHSVTAGYLADFYESERFGPRSGADNRTENRLRLSWRFRRGDTALLEVIETLDLDGEDHGQFWIHDHFFLMLLLGF